MADNKKFNENLHKLSEEYNIDKDLLWRYANYKKTYSKEWFNVNPLILKRRRDADTISKVFTDIALIVSDLRQLGRTDRLTTYIRQLNSLGIELTIKPRKDYDRKPNEELEEKLNEIINREE